jgi:tRNA1(Val) A37 N6-methylase TrmN6
MNLTHVTNSGNLRQPGISSLYDARGQAVRSALLELLGVLDDLGYNFIAPTPSTHARVISRPERCRARTLRDVFGWSLAFDCDLLPGDMFDLLRTAGVISARGDGMFNSAVRVSRVHDILFLHSSYPTTDYDSVFLGPDSYRFADLVLANLGPVPVGARILDYGTGAGVGGIVAARHVPGAVLTLADRNPKALFLATINAEHAGVIATPVEVDSPAALKDRFDLLVTHPPFMMDNEGRAYRDGGELYGAALSLDWVVKGIERLSPGGSLVLHTGVSIVDGVDVLREKLRDALPSVGLATAYRELDPDIFGDELEKPAYREVDRIAAVGLIVRRVTPGDHGAVLP